MVDIVLEFFGIVGVNLTAPTTFGELIVWLATVGFGVAIVSYVFKGVFGLVRALCGGRLF